MWTVERAHFTDKIAALEAELAAAKARPSLGKRVYCPTCGCVPAMASRAEDLVTRNALLVAKHDAMAGRLGVSQARAELDAQIARASQASLQRKVSRQGRAIRSLEAKLAKRGESPYEDAQ
jgi:hypothetical protein